MSELHQCPCNPACKCAMTEPCLGCEDYAIWIQQWTDIAKKLIAANVRKEDKNETEL